MISMMSRVVVRGGVGVARAGHTAACRCLAPKQGAIHRSQETWPGTEVSLITSQEFERVEDCGERPRVSSLTGLAASPPERPGRVGQSAGRRRPRLPEAGMTAPSERRWTSLLSMERASGAS